MFTVLVEIQFADVCNYVHEASTGKTAMHMCLKGL